MPKIAVLGGNGYLASIIKNQNNIKKNEYTFFSREKNSENFINYVNLKNNISIFKNFDIILHLVGPSNKEINKKLLKEKKNITINICNLCIKNNIKLIYVSSMQVYKNYGKNNIIINSKKNLSNLYAKSHYESEKIINRKFINNKNMFLIIRLGNVFGFKKFEDFSKIKNNLVHSLCFSAYNEKKILIKNGSIQRTFIPSNIFIHSINTIIKKNYFKNSIINVVYKNLSLKNFAKIIKKRIKVILKLNVEIIIEKNYDIKNYVIYRNKNFYFNPDNKIIDTEIDQILKKIKKIKNYITL